MEVWSSPWISDVLPASLFHSIYPFNHQLFLLIQSSLKEEHHNQRDVQLSSIFLRRKRRCFRMLQWEPLPNQQHQSSRSTTVLSQWHKQVWLTTAFPGQGERSVMSDRGTISSKITKSNVNMPPGALLTVKEQRPSGVNHGETRAHMVSAGSVVQDSRCSSTTTHTTQVGWRI